MEPLPAVSDPDGTTFHVIEDTEPELPPELPVPELLLPPPLDPELPVPELLLPLPLLDPVPVPELPLPLEPAVPLDPAPVDTLVDAVTLDPKPRPPAPVAET